jgi:hypothetical protein
VVVECSSCCSVVLFFSTGTPERPIRDVSYKITPSALLTIIGFRDEKGNVLANTVALKTKQKIDLF